MLAIKVLFVLAGLYSVETLEYLKHVSVVYRHGDRTPVDPYPNDPYKNESLWPVKFGQLTVTGMRQHYRLGEWFRRRYTNLVKLTYDPSEIYVRSTDVDRAIMSAQANLAGMFPPPPESKFYNNISWTPLPVHSVPASQDNVLAMSKQCLVYEHELKEVKTSDAYQKGLSKYQDLMDYLSYHTGVKVTDYVQILNIFSVLKIENLYNFPLPAWTYSVFPNEMETPACFAFSVESSNRLLARLKVGPLFNKIVRTMLKIMHTFNSKEPEHPVKYDDVDGVEPLKLNVYSAHDITIGNILTALGLFDGKCPAYTATIMFELVYDDAALVHFVKVFYRNSIDLVEPQQLDIPSCGKRCPLEQFAKLYKHLMVNDWEKECQLKPLISYNEIVIASCVITLFIILCKCFAICNERERARQTNVCYVTVCSESAAV